MSATVESAVALDAHPRWAPTLVPPAACCSWRGAIESRFAARGARSRPSA